MPIPEAAIIEIVEYTDEPDPAVIVPTDIRINGASILAPADDPVIVHQIAARANDIVKVTLTLFAKRVTIAAEPRPRRILKPGPDISQDQIIEALHAAGHEGEVK